MMKVMVVVYLAGLVSGAQTAFFIFVIEKKAI